jgi:hypothetical protein
MLSARPGTTDRRAAGSHRAPDPSGIPSRSPRRPPPRIPPAVRGPAIGLGIARRHRPPPCGVGAILRQSGTLCKAAQGPHWGAADALELPRGTGKYCENLRFRARYAVKSHRHAFVISANHGANFPKQSNRQINRPNREPNPPNREASENHQGCARSDRQVRSSRVVELDRLPCRVTLQSRSTASAWMPKWSAQGGP